MKGNKLALGLITLITCGFSLAHASVSVPMNLIDADGKTTAIGQVILENSKYGLMIQPALYGLPPGLHGFHIHVTPNCDHAGDAAGGHLDPAKTNKHLGPYQNGHLGDLPALYVATNGQATVPVVAPRLKLAQVENHALMIHAGGDNYSDEPEKLGGGGKRIACGVIP